MPQDTTYYLTPGQADSLVSDPITIEQFDSLLKAGMVSSQQGRPPQPDPGIVPRIIAYLFFITMLFCCVWMIIIRIRAFTNAHLGTFFVSKKKRFFVSSLLQLSFPYYQQLPDKQKDEFVRRAICFRRSKEFKFQNMEKSSEACYLISASAIQLTFGLEDFMLSHFTTIHVINGEYRHFAYEIPFQGHTSNGEIYFSWPHFKHGYEMNNDKQNVGLHEMAHALTWQCFYSDATGDPHFTKTFYHYSVVGRPLFARMQEGERNLLGDYATTNYDEFWATSVEVFFEQPVQMRRELPELYNVLCLLLRQYPCAAR